MADAIVARGLGKRFSHYDAQRPTTLKAALVQGFRRMQPAAEFWALRDVSFRVPPGRMVGIIGRNGAGKSTLLRLIGGVGRPDEGSVTVNGRIGALLELGEGFNEDLTGRENAFISGIVAGLTRAEVEERFDEIVAFAELEEWIDNPVRTYSTGMEMRLAFAVAVHTDPRVLLVDETLAVGDLAFQAKCLHRIGQLKDAGCAILLVSHDDKVIRRTCDEVIWINKGSIVAQGSPDVVTGQYVVQMEAETRRRTPVSRPPLRTPGGVELRVHENRFGSLELEIVGARLVDRAGFAVSELDSGDSLRVEIHYRAPEPIPAPIFGVTLSNEEGTILLDAHTEAAELELPTLTGAGTLSVTFERLDLVGGQYYVDVAAYEGGWAYAYDHHWHAYPLLIRKTPAEEGVLAPPLRWEIGASEAGPVGRSDRERA
jgi:lipopolysaccharide transport system ATP-binding protein